MVAIRCSSSSPERIAASRPGVLNSGQDLLGCHGTRYVRYGRGWYAYPVRTVRGALGAGRPARPVRTQRGRLVRVACTYATEAPGRSTCQLSGEHELARARVERVRREGVREVARPLVDALDEVPDELPLRAVPASGCGWGLGAGLGLGSRVRAKWRRRLRLRLRLRPEAEAGGGGGSGGGGVPVQQQREAAV